MSYDDALSVVKAHLSLDAATRILMPNAAQNTLSKKNGWKFKKNAPKAAFCHLVSVLQPPVLKKKVEEAVELDFNGIKYDYKSFLLS